MLPEQTTTSIVHVSTSNRMPAIVHEASVVNNAHAVDEPLHVSKRGEAAHCEERTSSTAILGFRPHHRHDLPMSASRTLSSDGRDPLSSERARAGRPRSSAARD
jgi:hypothetical protein